jgi:uncharacterized protein YbaP (TraB family)
MRQFSGFVPIVPNAESRLTNSLTKRIRMLFFGKSKEREMKMIWEVEKDGKRSFLIGTAHFFPFSFRTSLARHMERCGNVLFEGPLDPESMAKVVEAGHEEGGPHLFDELDRQTVSAIARAVSAPTSGHRFPFLLLPLVSCGSDQTAYALIEGMKPWLAFFTIWSTFLKKKGWTYSVDMEAYNVAKKMGRNIIPMETIEEQIEVLEGLSHERIIAFLKRIDHWEAFAQGYVRTYLDGDLENLKSMGLAFPSRHFHAIGRRDRIFHERMLGYLDDGNTLVCVGAPHVRGLARLLAADGYQIRGNPINQ